MFLPSQVLPFCQMFTTHEKAKLVRYFFENNSIIEAQRRFQVKYGKNAHDKNSIRWVKTFEETGSVFKKEFWAFE